MDSLILWIIFILAPVIVIAFVLYLISKCLDFSGLSGEEDPKDSQKFNRVFPAFMFENSFGWKWRIWRGFYYIYYKYLGWKKDRGFMKD